MQVDSYMRRYPIGRIPTHWLLPQILLREVRRSSAGRGCQALEHRYLKTSCYCATFQFFLPKSFAITSICLSVLATLLPVRQEENIIRISQLYGVSLFILEYLLSLIILNYSFLFQFHYTQHPGSDQASKDPGRVPCTVQVPEGHFADGGHHSLHFRDSPIRRP